MEISPAHALILIIADRKTKENKQEELARLKRIFLVGITNNSDREYFKSLLKDPILSEHKVSIDPTVIDSCKIRRFFETLLCYETLKESINNLDTIKLEQFYQNLINIHTDYYNQSFPQRKSKTMQEYFDTKPEEYKDGHFRIDNEPSVVDHFNAEQRKKLHQLIESCIRCVLCTQTAGLKESLPKFIEVFEKNNYFSESRRRQRKLVQQKIIVPSNNFGLIFSITGKIEIDSPVANCKFEYKYIKPVEKATYAEKHAWADFVFPMLMHPFSNGASGTILGQLKLLYYFGNHAVDKTEQQKNEDCQFTKDYIKNLICVMLFLGGGHSLYEFMYPLSIKDVQDSLADFMGDDEIIFEDLFLNGNERVFNKTLDITAQYSKKVIAKHVSIFDVIQHDHVNDRDACIKIDSLCKANPHLIREVATSKKLTPLQLAVAKKMSYTLRTLVKYELSEDYPHRDANLKAALTVAKNQEDSYSTALLFLATLGIGSMREINTTLANGKTPYQMAVEDGSTRVQSSLKKYGAKIAS